MEHLPPFPPPLSSMYDTRPQVGKYKATPGTSACLACPAYATTAGNASTSPAACECKPGYYPDPAAPPATGGPCLACPRGTYKPDRSGAACAACPPLGATALGAAVSVAACA
jgi:hypothetical protein